MKLTKGSRRSEYEKKNKSCLVDGIEEDRVEEEQRRGSDLGGAEGRELQLSDLIRGHMANLLKWQFLKLTRSLLEPIKEPEVRAADLGEDVMFLSRSDDRLVLTTVWTALHGNRYILRFGFGHGLAITHINI